MGGGGVTGNGTEMRGGSIDHRRKEVKRVPSRLAEVRGAENPKSQKENGALESNIRRRRKYRAHSRYSNTELRGQLVQEILRGETQPNTRVTKTSTGHWGTISP